ncbi:MAG: helix-turn-helix transcriptional regulator [Desulfovibrio sp.]|nr:helix-turn-helix transcriptional regulator [Desulfovibrio sp.]
MFGKKDSPGLICEESSINEDDPFTKKITQKSVSTVKVLRFDSLHDSQEMNERENKSISVQLQDKIINFLYELPQGQDNFTENLLLLLYRYFGFKNAVFLYPNNVYNLKNIYDSSNSSADCIDRYMEDGIVKSASRQKGNRFFLKSPMSYERLPVELRDKDIVLSSELPKEYALREDYDTFYSFFDQYSFKFFASMRLAFPADTYIGRIGFAKTGDEGDFTDKELYILGKTAKHIAYHYYFAVDYYYKIEKIKLFDKLNSHLTTGLIAVNSELQVFCANKISYNYCMDILEHKKISIPKQHANKRIMQQTLIDMISDNVSAVLNEDSVKFICSKYVYLLSGVSCIVQDYKNDLIPYHFFYIARQDNTAATSFEKFVHKYNLSSREREILFLLDAGSNARAISIELYISHHTVKTHIANIFRKVNVSCRSALLHKLRHDKHDDSPTDGSAATLRRE